MLTTQNSATKKRHSQSVRSVCTYCSRSGLVHNSLWGLDICKGDGVGRVEKKMGVGAWRWLGGGRRREEVNFGMGSPPDTKQTWHPQLLHCLSSQLASLWQVIQFGTFRTLQEKQPHLAATSVTTGSFVFGGKELAPSLNLINQNPFPVPA